MEVGVDAPGANTPEPVFKLLPGLKFRLAPGITRGNVIVYFLGAFLGLLLIALNSSLQPSVLTQLGSVPLAEQGQRSGTLVLYNELVLLPAIFASGILADRFGRRIVYAGSFLASSLVFLYICTIHDGTGLIIAAMLVAVGTAGQGGMMGTVIADYSHPEDRGKAIACMGIVVGLGAMLGALVLARMPSWFTAAGFAPIPALKASFVVAACIALFASILMRAGLSAVRPVTQTVSPPMRKLARGAIEAARDPRVLLAYFAGFVSRCDMVVLSFLTLWVNKAAYAAGLSPAEAAGRAGMTFGIAQSAAWVSGAFVATQFDRLAPARALALALFLAALGYGGMLFVHDALGTAMILGAVGIGIGQIASLLGSQAYVAKVAPDELRGSVIGGFGFCGAVGTLMAALVGGVLFDRTSESAPFVAVGALSLLLAITATWMRARGRV